MPLSGLYSKIFIIHPPVSGPLMRLFARDETLFFLRIKNRASFPLAFGRGPISKDRQRSERLPFKREETRTEAGYTGSQQF